MVIGYNVAYFRRAAGLTQEQLGEPLGWTKVAVSAAERSWDGKRVRKFDADEILRIALVFKLPVAALFLPPEDDGRDKRYIIGERGHGQPMAMQGLLEFAMSEPTEDDRPVMRAYENRLVSAVSKYLPSGAAEAVATRLKQRTTEQQLARALREARANHEILDRFYDTIDELIKDNNLLQDFLVAMLGATPEGQVLAERLERGERPELAGEQQRRAWDNLPPAQREWQKQVVGIGKELFGERGPANRSEIDQVIAEARKRGADRDKAAAVLSRHDGTYELVRPYDASRQDAEGS